MLSPATPSPAQRGMTMRPSRPASEALSGFCVERTGAGGRLTDSDKGFTELKQEADCQLNPPHQRAMQTSRARQRGMQPASQQPEDQIKPFPCLEEEEAACRGERAGRACTAEQGRHGKGVPAAWLGQQATALLLT